MSTIHTKTREFIKNTHQIFLSAAAACAVAFGTGYLATLNQAFAIEKEAKKIEFELEQQLRAQNENRKSFPEYKPIETNINTETECDKLGGLSATCNYVQYLQSTNHSFLGLHKNVGVWFILLFFIFSGIGAIGMNRYKIDLKTEKAKPSEEE